MEYTISEEDLEILLNKIKRETLRPSITEINLTEINNIIDNEERKKIRSRFDIINELYVKPLQRVAINITKDNQLNSLYSLNNLSILERMDYYSKILLKNGYTSSQIMDIIPKTEEEIELIIYAKINGFNDSKFLNNDSKITAAKKYLEKKTSITKKG